MGHGAGVGSAAGNELRVGRDEEVVHPSLGARPHGAGAVVDDLPGDRDGLAGEGGGRDLHVADDEVGGGVGDVAGGGAGVVVGEGAFEDGGGELLAVAGEDVLDVPAREVPELRVGHLAEWLAEGLLRPGDHAADDLLDLDEEQLLARQDRAGLHVGLDDEVAALGRRGEGEGGGLGVGLAGAERAVVGEAEDHPVLALAVVGVVVGGEVDGVGPHVEVGGVGAVVGDGPGEGDLLAAGARGRCGEGGDLEVGGRGVDDGDGGGLEVVAVEVVGGVGVDVDVEGLLVDVVVGVGPGGEEVLAGELGGDGDGDVALVVFAHVERPTVAEGAEQDVAALGGGAGPAPVAGEPDGVGPRAGVGDAGTEVGDAVVDGDAGAVEGIDWPDDARDDQVGRRDGHNVHGDLPGGGVVVLLRILVHDAACVGLDDDVDVAGNAGRDDGGGVGGVGPVGGAGAQGAAVGQRRQEHVARVPGVVEGQVDAVGPPRAARGGRDEPHVGHRPLDVDHASGLDALGGREGGDLEVGPRGERDGDPVEGPDQVVALAGLDESVGEVGVDEELVDALDVAGQLDVLGALVGVAGAEALDPVELAELDGTADVAVGREVEGIAPRARRVLWPVVPHGPGDIHPIAVLSGQWPFDHEDGEVGGGRRHVGDGDGVGAAGVVVGVDELVGAAGGDEDVVGAAGVARERDVHGAGVGVAHGEGAEMAERREVPPAGGAGRVGGRPHLVGPARDVGDADALVGDGPGHFEGLAVLSRRLGGDDVHHQVGVGDRGDVHQVRGLGHVGAGVGVLVDGVGGVGGDEQVEPPLRGRRERDDLGAGILGGVGVNGHEPRVHELADDAVVAVAVDGVGRQDHAVGPRVHAAGAGAFVGDGPRDREVHGVADDQWLCRHVVDVEVGIGGQGDRHLRRGRHVVALAPALLHLVRGVGRDEDVVGAVDALGQRDAELAGIGIAWAEGATVRQVAERHVVAREGVVVGQGDAIGPVGGRGAGAGVAAGPLDGDIGA